MSASTVWNFAATDFPADASARQKMGHAVKCAMLAALVDEWQPWQFRLHDRHVELFAEIHGSTLADDSQEREVMLRCGAALFHLKLALKYFGCLGIVEMFPDLEQTRLVARIHLGFGRARDAQESAMLEAMIRDGAQSSSDDETPVDESMVEMFRDSGAGEKAWLEFSQCDSSRSRLVALAESGMETSATIHRRVPQPDNSRVAQWAKPLLMFVVRTGSAGNITVKTGGRRANEMALLALIKTKTDDKHGWLATGQALARIRLLTRASRISSQVFARIFLNRQARTELRTSIGHKGFAQAIVGFGSSSASPMWDLPNQERAVATFR